MSDAVCPTEARPPGIHSYHWDSSLQLLIQVDVNITPFTRLATGHVSLSRLP
ncbi:hypothetical protein FEAC_22070 [Ferrimicrobium acidiphilum DSM 19497]|uniref:Uncharacterized protein n=1 Tax=Ferrimicrobium acidiphilum DSM 19497 TaxID=1121877 RepID=A0A0D8FST5_9ACTN|nr:hypothetical protein FEAC_22070 [Ferrimicrobium acidiphilum DSM 19497]